MSIVIVDNNDLKIYIIIIIIFYFQDDRLQII